jgi:ketosteroid isomerase-like protein
MNDSDALIAAEHAWKDAMAAHDRAALDRIVAPDCRLIVGVAGRPFQIMSRERWLGTIHLYEPEWIRFDDLQVTVAGDIGIVSILWTQKATVQGVDRSATFFVTDIWRRDNGEWRVIERHSARPEAPTASSDALRDLSRPTD